MNKDNRFYIKDVGISKTNMDDALIIINKQVKKNQSAYVCISDSRAVHYAVNNNDYCTILNNSLVTTPDGKPLEVIARLKGYKEVSRTCGSDLFNAICRISEKNDYTHFFYGCTQTILDKMLINLKKKYPFLKIVGAVAPPFGTPEELASDAIIQQLNSIEPNFVWLGLGAPKQEYVANIMVERLRKSIIIGIGLVFEYEAKTVIRAPIWMRKVGLEGLYRICQQPIKSKRFIVPIFWILYQMMKTFMSRNLKRG